MSFQGRDTKLETVRAPLYSTLDLKLIVDKVRLLRKKLLKETFFGLQKWGKNIQTGGYNGQWRAYAISSNWIILFVN